MKVILGLLSRFRPQTFKLGYASEYKTFLQHHAASDPLHPLHILRRREMKARKREGLWWHVTSGVDLSKSGVVRTWCRRRLRNAFTEALKERGFDEFGRLVNVAILREHNGFDRVSQRNQDLSLTGSVRFHITPALVTARYADVREETNTLVNILLEGVKADAFSTTKTTRAQPEGFARLKSLPPSKLSSQWKPPLPSRQRAHSKTHSQSEKPARTIVRSQTNAPSSHSQSQSTPFSLKPHKTHTVRTKQQSVGKPGWRGWHT